MDSQINKVHSPTIFCVVPSDLMRFWVASFSPSALTSRQLQEKLTRRAVQLSRPLTAECLPNLAECFPPEDNDLEAFNSSSELFCFSLKTSLFGCEVVHAFSRACSFDLIFVHIWA